jgi:UDP-N-acetylglucosamine diphosphorylase/glucosamine-1-phosphate N-acetyltransferase
LSSVVVFEDEGWENFVPLSLTRHVSQQLLGTGTILSHLSKMFEGEVALAGRGLVAAVAKEETGVEFNGPLEKDVFLINARTNPIADLGSIVSKKTDFFLLDGTGGVVMATLPRERYQSAVAKDGTVSAKKLAAICKGLEALESSQSLLFRYPWELIALNDKAIVRGAGPLGRKRELARGKGRGVVRVSPDAEVEEQVSFDTRDGSVIVESGARIESFSRISGPCFIGRNSVIHSALVRGGTTIGEGCRVGGEVDHSIVYPFSNKAHLGFLGHSAIGSWVNLGAGSVTSDLKNTYGTVKVVRGGARVDSGMVKLGAIVGDMAKVASGTTINGGKSLGVSSHCSGLVDRDVPDFTHFGDRSIGGQEFAITLGSVIETQSRMMLRRGQELSEARRTLLKQLYARSRAAHASRS